LCVGALKAEFPASRTEPLSRDAVNKALK
jgi:hypothetical protein